MVPAELDPVSSQGMCVGAGVTKFDFGTGPNNFVFLVREHLISIRGAG